MMKKRVVALVLCIGMAFAGVMSVQASNTTKTLQIVVNGETIVFPDASPFMDENGRVQVPVRFVAEALNATVGWYSSTQTFTVERGQISASLTIGSNEIMVMGEVFPIDTAPIIIQSRTFVPLRFISEALGADVRWSSEDFTAYITDWSFFSLSEGIADNGFWKGIKALDYVEIFNYKALPVPSEVYNLSDEGLQLQINKILADYSSYEQVLDRAVAAGDMVNIDYVGSIDGVEFEGGSTRGLGTDVVAGGKDYIDDFLDQIIGHKPGETVNVEVTFPNNYHVEDLMGKDALFITKINYISEYPKLTDKFVLDNLSNIYGWTTADELKDGLRSEFHDIAIQNAIPEYIFNYLSYEVPVKSVPDQLIRYQEQVMMSNVKEYADYYNMGLDEFLMMSEGISGVEELIQINRDKNLAMATNSLVLQAVAEDAGFSVSEEDLKKYFTEFVGTSDYSEFEMLYGLPYLKQFVLHKKVHDYILENIVLS